MTLDAPRRFVLDAIFLLGLVLPTQSSPGQGRLPTAPAGLDDPRLSGLRQAAASWDLRPGPARKVVDQVCLVPDVATFYEALASWDERQFFPILIDDVDLTLKFLHAFRPAKVVRYPRRGRAIEGEDAIWDRAVRAAGGAWTDLDAVEKALPRGDERPAKLGATPPGIVVGSPRSESLPGLAALAAGRFQPLVRLDVSKRYADVLSEDEAVALVNQFADAVGAKIPDYARLGDDCDFITLAGDYPYRYTGKFRNPNSRREESTTMAVDDRIGRPARADGERWAFTGRLMGDERRSVYAAMCSLFLQPESALLFNGYPEGGDPPWPAYTMRPAFARLRTSLATTLVSGEKNASVKGWHDAVDPTNRHGLLLINTSGSPTIFNLPGGQGSALDIPPSVPTAIAIIHSYSAADPTDPNTVAGRWLAQGAFLYHGSVDEPYLVAFRTPGLVADLLVEGVPFGAATRMTRGEMVGIPWKLTLLGDPLYRLRPRDAIAPRVPADPASSGWTAYAQAATPRPDAPETARLGWAVNAAIARASSGDAGDDILAVLRGIDRGHLPTGHRAVFDELTTTLLYRANRLAEVRALVRKVAPDERSPLVTRLGISAAMAEFHRSLDRRDFDRASSNWNDLIRVRSDRSFSTLITARLSSLADSPVRRDEWRNRLRGSLAGLKGTEAGEAAAEELRRVEEVIRSDRGR